MLRRALAVAGMGCLIGAGVVVVGRGSPVEAASIPPAAHTVGRYAPIYMDPSFTVTSMQQATWLAQNFDVITAEVDPATGTSQLGCVAGLPIPAPGGGSTTTSCGTPGSPGYLPDYVSDMRAANPHLVILTYLNATLAQAYASPGEDKCFPSGPGGWYLYNAQGQAEGYPATDGVRSVEFGNWLMNPLEPVAPANTKCPTTPWAANTPTWADAVANECYEFYHDFSYNGCFLDVLGDELLSGSYLTSPPIDPLTHEPWTGEGWLQATQSITAAVRAKNPTIALFGNGLEDGSKYFEAGDPSSQVLQNLDGGQSELWIRQAYDGVTTYRPEPEWLEDVNEIVAAQNEGRNVLATVKVWLPAGTVTEQQYNAWHVYALASFLLATNGSSFFNFSEAPLGTAITDDPACAQGGCVGEATPADAAASTALDEVNLGQPIGGYSQEGSVFFRRFTGGLVAVNPNPLPAQPICLGAAYKNVDTGALQSSIDLAGNSAVILQSVGASTAQEYQMAASDGGIFSFGGACFAGSMGGTHLNEPVVGMAATPDGQGYWLVASDGGVFTFGLAAFHGSTGDIRLNQPIVGMAVDPATGGYWLVAADGGIFSFDAPFFGSTGGIHLNKPIVGMAATPDGRGYWLVASDGGVFSFGDAAFHGSTGDIHLNQPIVGMAASPTGGGYWLVARDGGIFSFGDAPFLGSTGGVRLNQPVVGMAATHDGLGYWLTASDGGVFTFGDAAFGGSLGGIHLNKPIVGISSP
jgi:hypothetical protein